MIINYPSQNGFYRKLSIFNQIQNPLNVNGNLLKNKTIDHYYENSNEFFFKDLYAHFGCVNSVEFSNDGRFMVSGGDDKRVLLWDFWKAISSNLFFHLSI